MHVPSANRGLSSGTLVNTLVSTLVVMHYSNHLSAGIDESTLCCAHANIHTESDVQINESAL